MTKLYDQLSVSNEICREELPGAPPGFCAEIKESPA